MPNIDSIRKYKNVHMIGIGGVSMSGIAAILKNWNFTVTGSDSSDSEAVQNLLKKGIKVVIGHSLEDVANSDVVVYSAAIKPDDPEMLEAKRLNIPTIERADFLGELTRCFKDTICISGTHGKTTTSTLITHVLKNTLGCNYFIGDGTGHASLDNNLFVIESCEFNRHFLSYEPTYTVLTNIELEHTETYQNLEDIISTFQAFASKTKKKIIACGDDENIRKLELTQEVIYYGLNDNNDVVAKNIDYSSKNTTFDCYIKNKFAGRITIPLYGKHMVLNTLACLAMLMELNISRIEERWEVSLFKKNKFIVCLSEDENNYYTLEGVYPKKNMLLYKYKEKNNLTTFFIHSKLLGKNQKAFMNQHSLTQVSSANKQEQSFYQDESYRAELALPSLKLKM